VARLLLNDGLEDRDQWRGEQAGLLGETKQSEGEERIEALAILGPHEGPFEISGQRVGGLLGDRQPVAPGHEREESRMPRLFVPLELDRLAKERVALRPTECGHLRRGIGLGRERLGPEGQRAQPLELYGPKLRPGEASRV
jgi:hypothetical protein